MTDHDEMCSAPGSTLSGCICADLRKRDARVRADEREEVAQEIEERMADDPHFQPWADAMKEAARIARREQS